jgi:hypothetical protein
MMKLMPIRDKYQSGITLIQLGLAILVSVTTFFLSLKIYSEVVTNQMSNDMSKDIVIIFSRIRDMATTSGVASIVDVSGRISPQVIDQVIQGTSFMRSPSGTCNAHYELAGCELPYNTLGKSYFVMAPSSEGDTRVFSIWIYNMSEIMCRKIVRKAPNFAGAVSSGFQVAYSNGETRGWPWWSGNKPLTDAGVDAMCKTNPENFVVFYINKSY